jgi:hypothetical protein
MTELLLALMHRNNLHLDDAKEIINEIKSRISEGENPEDLLFEIGFEPDYVFDLI